MRSRALRLTLRRTAGERNPSGSKSGCTSSDRSANNRAGARAPPMRRDAAAHILVTALVLLLHVMPVQLEQGLVVLSQLARTTSPLRPKLALKRRSSSASVAFGPGAGGTGAGLGEPPAAGETGLGENPGAAVTSLICGSSSRKEASRRGLCPSACCCSPAEPHASAPGSGPWLLPGGPWRHSYTLPATARR